MCPVYVSGLIGPGDRKSIQPMAERIAVGEYDQLHHFIAAGVWDATPVETELLVQADRLVGGSDAVLVIDDTAIPKKGTHSVGVAAQIRFGVGKNLKLLDPGIADVLCRSAIMGSRCRRMTRASRVRRKSQWASGRRRDGLGCGAELHYDLRRSRGPSSPFTGSNPFSPATQSTYFGASEDFTEKSRHSVRLARTDLVSAAY